MATTDTQTFLDGLRTQLSNAPDGVDTSTIEAAINALANSEEERVKIWFLLDRSGSMQPVASDVVGGFNQFVADQAAKPGKARLTAVQFDSDNPFEIILDRSRIDRVPELTSAVYWARSMTPLYDALGMLIERADRRIKRRVKENRPAEDQLVVVFTDGLENASRKFSLRQVFDMVRDRMDQDWTFVFMGANQDSYAEGGHIGLVDGNIQDYAATPESVAAAFDSMSRATREYRGKPRFSRVADKERFFGGLKEAEEALRNKKS